MISLEQVRALEDRVEKAVAYIASLREHGAELERRLAETQSFVDEAAEELAASEAKLSAVEAQHKAEASATAARVREVESRLADMAERVAAAETRAAELSSRADEYRKDQAKIEEGIVHALKRLDSFEDLMLSETDPTTIAETPAAQATESAEVPMEPQAMPSAPRSEPESGSGIAIKSTDPSPVNELDIF